MSSKPLKDNAELYQFLCKLAENLRDAQYIDLAESIERASLFANGSPSEFLHESKVALEQVNEVNPAQIDTKEVHRVVVQIKDAFQKIGGA